MNETRLCPDCGAEIPADAPAGQCPRCLLKAGFNSEAPSSEPELAATALSPPPRGFEPPPVAELAASFPQLEILELLGKGGMGAVYQARQPGLDRLVAVKILPPEVGDDPAFAERFSREARAMARLSHPNIVAIHDFGQTDGFFYFVMEYIDGANLRQAMQAGKLSPEEALAIVPQICDALQFAHDEGIVHRDVKPENILLDRKGRVKIADFGLSKLLGEDHTDVSLTGTHQVMGTLRYMAPEQMQGTKSVDHRADIYSLGVVFYELLTGDVPMGRFAPPSQKVQIDVRLDEVVLRALEQEPDKRYQRAGEIKTDIGHATSHPAHPQPVPRDKSLRRLGDRHSWRRLRERHGDFAAVGAIWLMYLILWTAWRFLHAFSTGKLFTTDFTTITDTEGYLFSALLVGGVAWLVIEHFRRRIQQWRGDDVTTDVESDLDYVRRKMTGPAVALMVAAIANLIGNIVFAGWWFAEAASPLDMVHAVLYPAFNIGVSFLLLSAAGGLLRGESSPVGDFAITISLIIPPGLVIAIPAVILYWLRYEEPRVKAVFKVRQDAGP